MKKRKQALIFLGLVSLILFYVLNRATGFFIETIQEDNLTKLIYVMDNLSNEIKSKPFKIYLQKEPFIAGFLGILIVILMYLYSTFGRKNYLVGKEHGSAKWGTEEDIKDFKTKEENKNIILTKTEGLNIDTRKTLRNNNIVVVGGAGAGKTRFFVKPNLLQKHTSYIITDPKGSLIKEVGKVLEDGGYKIKVLNLIDMAKSDKYNFFSYLRTESDVLKIVNNLVSNTKSKESKDSGDFFEKAEILLLQALFAYVLFETEDEEEKNINTVMDLLRLAEVREDDEAFVSPLDIMFNDLEVVNPNSFALKQYQLFKMAAGKTLKSILISVGVRLSPFNIKEVQELLSKDTLEIDTLGDKKTALFVIISDTDKTFNFIVAMMYQQLFDRLFYKADNEYGGRLPVHVRGLLDEFANIGQIPNFETYVATMRSREISVSIILQNLAQLKSLYKDSWETITGNCDTLLFLGGKEESTLKYISEMVGKTTIDLKTINESKGQSGSITMNEQVVGRDLITSSEVGLLKTNQCILSIRGVSPFLSEKYDLESHPEYKKTLDYDKKNAYEIKTYIAKRNEEFFKNISEIQELVNEEEKIEENKESEKQSI